MVSVTDSAGKICCAVCFDPMSQHEKQGDAYVSCDGVRMLFRD